MNQREMHRTGIREAKMRVALDVVGCCQNAGPGETTRRSIWVGAFSGETRCISGRGAEASIADPL